MIIFLLGKHIIFTRSDGHGGTIIYNYYDEMTWIVCVLVVVWLIWILVRRYRRLRALRRPPTRVNRKALERVINLKSELTSNYLRPGFSTNIHAVGVGVLGGEYCIQVFIKEAREETAVPDNYRGVPVLRVEMAGAAFVSGTSSQSNDAWEQYPNGIREFRDVIVGGISGANANLTGANGTIGYFCTRKSKFRRSKEVYLLSNSHVFADLRKAKVDDRDLIMQPSPGEAANNRPVATLINFSALNFDGDINESNHIDAAIAKLWGTRAHNAVIPLVGAVKGHVETKDVEVGESVRKFGRTTGYTEGRVYSIYLDIWIKYDRTGQAAFFEDQILIEPAVPKSSKFVAKGDSGSLLVDANQFAIGLIFAGVSEVPEDVRAISESDADKTIRIEGYGVANPISEVLDRLKIELLI